MEQANDLRKIAYILRGLWAGIKDNGFEQSAMGISTLQKELLRIADELEGKNTEEE